MDRTFYVLREGFRAEPPPPDERPNVTFLFDMPTTDCWAKTREAFRDLTWKDATMDEIQTAIANDPALCVVCLPGNDWRPIAQMKKHLPVLVMIRGPQDPPDEVGVLKEKGIWVQRFEHAIKGVS